MNEKNPNNQNKRTSPQKLASNAKYLATGTGTVKTFALRMPQQWYQPLRDYVSEHEDVYLSVNDMICQLIAAETGFEYLSPKHSRK